MLSDFSYLILGFLFCLFYAINKTIKINSNPREKKKINNIHMLWYHLDGGAMFFGFLFSPLATPIMGAILLFNLFFLAIFEIKKHRDQEHVKVDVEKKQRQAIIRRVNEKLGIDD